MDTKGSSPRRRLGDRTDADANVNFRIAQRFNERHDRVGHLFQGRFGARAIEGDAHFSNVAEYVLDNAVRAGLCATREEWPWLGGELVADLR